MKESPEELIDSEISANEFDPFLFNESNICSSTPTRRFSTRITRGVRPQRLTYQ